MSSTTIVMISLHPPALGRSWGLSLPARAGLYSCSRVGGKWICVSAASDGCRCRYQPRGCGRRDVGAGCCLERCGVATIHDQHVANSAGQGVCTGSQLGNHACRRRAAANEVRDAVGVHDWNRDAGIVQHARCGAGDDEATRPQARGQVSGGPVICSGPQVRFGIAVAVLSRQRYQYGAA